MKNASIKNLFIRHTAQKRIYEVLFWLVVCIGLLLGVNWGMPSEFVPEIDSEFPMGPLALWSSHGSAETSQVYPVFHKVLLSPVYAAVFGVLKLIGGFGRFSTTWPYGMVDPISGMWALIVSSRIITVAMGFGTVLFLYCCISFMARRSGDAESKLRAVYAIYPTLGLFFSGVFCFYSRTTNLDVPQLFWWVASYSLLLKFLFGEKPDIRTLIGSAAFSALSAATKDQGIIFAFSHLLILATCRRHNSQIRRVVFDVLAYSATLAVVYCTAAILPDPVKWVAHVQLIMPDHTMNNKFTMFPPDLAGQYSLVFETGSLLSRICSPLFLLIGFIGAVALIVKRERRWLATLIIPHFFFYIVMLVNIRVVYERFLLNAAFAPMLLVPAGMRQIEEWLYRCNIKVRVASFVVQVIAVGAIGWQLVGGYLPVTYAQLFDTKRSLALQVKKKIPEKAIIAWEGKRVCTLPNANIYAKYRLVVPDSVKKAMRSSRVEHVFSEEIDSVKYVISDHDLFTVGAGNPLVKKWNPRDWVDTSGLQILFKISHPDWVERNSFPYKAAREAQTFLVSQPYYVYTCSHLKKRKNL